MICPRCKIPLIPDSIRDAKYSVAIEKCPQCEGIWFDKDELSSLEKIEEPTLFEIRRIPGKKIQLQALYCPSCDNKQLMEKAEHKRDKKVIIDYCPKCNGIWLDKGELAAIQKENVMITIGNIFKWLFGND